MSEDRRKGLAAVALIALIVGVLASSMWVGRISAAEREERDDLELFLDASSSGWAQVTAQFFTVPESAAQTIGALLLEDANPGQQLNLLAEVMRTSADIDSAFIGLPDGSFFFVSRSDVEAPQGFRSKVISFDEGERQVTLSWTDSQLEELRSEIDPDDDFDPRERPWFAPIAAGADQHWTSPYVFASSQEPGITHSRAVRNEAGALIAVVGIDIRLTQLSRFLSELRPGANGESLVVDRLGRVISESPMNVDAMAHDANSGELALNQSAELVDLLGELQSSETMAALGRSPDSVRTTVVRPAGAGDEWFLAVRALDEDFISDHSTSNAFEIFAVGLTAAAAIVMLGLLILRYVFGLKNEATHDDLTGALNRRAIKRELRTMLSRTKGDVHIAIIDLDNFKQINDQYGHSVGDAVLRAATEHMDSFAAEATLRVGRLGGDEFIVFGEDANLDWSDLTNRIATPVMVDGRRHSVTASVGVAKASPDDQRDLDELLSAADRLLFVSKRDGGATISQEAGSATASKA